MRSSSSVGSFSASSEIELLLSSVANDTVKEVLGVERWMSETFAPVTVESYAGVKVNHCCPSAPSEKCGENTYGWLKSSLTPRSSAE